MSDADDGAVREEAAPSSAVLDWFHRAVESGQVVVGHTRMSIDDFDKMLRAAETGERLYLNLPRQFGHSAVRSPR